MNELNLKQKEIDDTLQRAIKNTKSSVKAERLAAFSRLCGELVNKSISLKITLIVKYMVENGYKMSEQSIYNKQEGGNPYRKLFDLWGEYSAIKQADLKLVVKDNNNKDSFIDYDDLKLIEDPALRYRISLMFGEIKGLKKQNDLMKKVKEMNVIHSVPEYLIESKQTSEILLTDFEIEILKELTLSNSHTSFNEDGALVANLSIRKGQLLSSQGLRNALAKVLSSYGVNIQ